MISSRILHVLGIAIILIAISLIPGSFNDHLSDLSGDLQLKIRGDRQLSDELVIIYLGAEDVNVLGGWPISRDYYGYATLLLDSLGAKAIGIDILFDKSDPYYEEYDRTFVSTVSAAKNVCLPMIFSELTRGDDKEVCALVGTEAQYPFDALREAAVHLGFSNLGVKGNIRRAPLVAAHHDTIVYSFGLALALAYLDYSGPLKWTGERLILTDYSDNETKIQLDDACRLRLNHFGGINDVQAVSFVDLLLNHQTMQDSIDFRDKLAMIIVTAPGIAKLKTTPLANAFPASLLQATIAENIIKGNYLGDVPRYVLPLLILLMSLLGWLIWRAQKSTVMLTGIVGIVLLYLFVSIVIFRTIYYIIPLIYPFVGFSLTLALLSMLRAREKSDQHKLLNEQIASKENQLNDTRVKLSEIEKQLKDETSATQEMKHIAEERRKAILKMEKELQDLKTYVVDEVQPSKRNFSEIIHSKNSAMAQALDLVTKAATDDIPVFILGETGTGKEMIARAIHQKSRRKNAPFIAVNCGALTETLLDSELFGHEKGSFTGAQSRRRGRFELADGGTIFLDEITETTPAFQARLLRVLQEGAFERVGGEKTISVNVRVLAATNRDVKSEMEENHFRADLFYRLNAFPIYIPPLRERREDIPLLAIHFLKKYQPESVPALSGRTMEILQQYQWPGNVRELENVIRRASVLAKSEGRDIIKESDIPEEMKAVFNKESYVPLEKQILDTLRTFKFSHSSISQTARTLGDRDRGTITEYFRGICFESFVKSGYDLDAAAREIAGVSDSKIISKVRCKIDDYLTNLTSFVSENVDDGDQLPPYKGLPKKYHKCLDQIFDHLKEQA
jgi:transcriptional regulator with GAF, ATPase, and Fis domain